MESQFKVAGMKVIRRAQGESVTQYTASSKFENLDDANKGLKTPALLSGLEMARGSM